MKKLPIDKNFEIPKLRTDEMFREHENGLTDAEFFNEEFFNEFPGFTFEMEGEPLTREHRIIGALVCRLGGSVELNERELAAIEGLSVMQDEIEGAFTITVHLPPEAETPPQTTLSENP